jgi:hypothetical protein
MKLGMCIVSPEPISIPPISLTNITAFYTSLSEPECYLNARTDRHETWCECNVTWGHLSVPETSCSIVLSYTYNRPKWRLNLWFSNHSWFQHVWCAYGLSQLYPLATMIVLGTD